jgi:hypothetical protein
MGVQGDCASYLKETYDLLRENVQYFHRLWSTYEIKEIKMC